MLKQIMQWQEDRNLDKMPYDHYNETLNLLEEICEMWGLDRDFAQMLCDRISEFGKQPESNLIIDGLFDLDVYSAGAKMKLGYNPIKVCEEGLREINERTGSYDASMGKWVKQPKKENAYKADFSKAKK